MATNTPIGRKVPDNFNRDSSTGVHYDTATYIGVVKNNKDSARSGRLQVWIPDLGGNQDLISNWRTVSYASPYCGSTYQPQSTQVNSFPTVNHTYGMWFVPPDLGNQVLCTFINGDLSRGYWFACISPTVSHYMTPGLAATTNDGYERSTISNDIKDSILPQKSSTPQSLPVVEFNESKPGAVSSNFYNNLKPIHEFQANILFVQGLDRDSVRGAISSSSQRESPSHVFGISTPGRALTTDPADDPKFAEKLAKGLVDPKQFAVGARKGGHQFVMDDGSDIGVDQLVRLRTAGGHQILMNDTNKMMYIANSEGSVWIELAQSGHLHIYSSGGFNLRSKGAINLHSDTDVNINAGNKINLNAGAEINAISAKINTSASDSLLLYGNKTSIGAGATLTQTGAKVLIGSGGAIKLQGATIDLNSGGSIPVVTGGKISTNSLADTSYDSKNRLWSEIPKSLTTIVSIAPAHEPWTRASANDKAPNVTPVAGPAPTNTVQSSICSPKAPAAPPAYKPPAPTTNKLDLGKYQGNPCPWTTDTVFLDKVKSICQTLNVNYIDMLACMWIETGGTFDPAIGNGIGYFGLIQFGPAACTSLKTTTAEICKLNRIDQCDWVLKYFQFNQLNQKAPAPKLQDLYLTIAWPVGVGKPDNTILAESTSTNPAVKAMWKRNPLWRTTPTGPVTPASVGAAAAAQLDLVKKALAAVPANAVTTSTGSAITDGSGAPITMGVAVDVGITKAAGQAVSNTCSVDILNKPTTYNPPSGLGNQIKLTQFQVKCLMAELGYFESKLSSAKINNDGTRIGKYQVDAAYLADKSRGYIKADALTQYKIKTLSKSESWTGKDQISKQDDFLANEGIQDSIQYAEFNKSYSDLFSNAGLVSSDDICTVAGMLFVTHQFRSAAKAKDWRDLGNLIDINGISGETYFNHGRYAIDVLSATNNNTPSTGATTTPAPTPSVSNSTTGINPLDVIVFSASGSGTLEAFKQTSMMFQNAILPAAQEYKKLTGKKVIITSAYRDSAYQQGLYDRWVSAGGKMPSPPGKNPAAGLNQPTKPVPGQLDSHGSGVAIDSTTASDMKSTIDLTKYGLRWGGEFGDPVHIQLKAWAKGAGRPADVASQWAQTGGVDTNGGAALGNPNLIKQTNAARATRGLAPVEIPPLTVTTVVETKAPVTPPPTSPSIPAATTPTVTPEAAPAKPADTKPC